MRRRQHNKQQNRKKQPWKYSKQKVWRTDISAQDTFDLFLLKSTFNDELVVTVNWTTALNHTTSVVVDSKLLNNYSYQSCIKHKYTWGGEGCSHNFLIAFPFPYPLLFPFPHLSPLFPFPPLLTPPPLPTSRFPSPPLQVGPLNPGMGSGECCKAPLHPGAEYSSANHQRSVLTLSLLWHAKPPYWHRWQKPKFAKTYGMVRHVSDVDNHVYWYISQHFWESGWSKLKMRYRPLSVLTTAQFVTVC